MSAESDLPAQRFRLLLLLSVIDRDYADFGTMKEYSLLGCQWLIINRTE